MHFAQLRQLYTIHNCALSSAYVAYAVTVAARIAVLVPYGARDAKT